MNDETQSARSRSEAVFSLAFVLLAAAASCIAWRVVGSLSYLIAAVGFVVLAPLWYRSPVSSSALRGPFGTRLTPRRNFTTLDKLCTFIGYGLLLTAVNLYIFGK